MEPIVDIHHAYVARGQNVVLHDVSLRIDPGENVAILGPNGCGKSTLLKTLTCELYPLVRPETNVRILGRERWDLTELRRMMGVVSTELPGKQTLASTGIDMILTGFFSSSTLWRHLVITPPMRARAEEILSLVDAERIGSRFFGEMSAGQRGRCRADVAVGRTIECAGSGGAT
jgi:iron complex transport system ATP-binding protein